MRSRSCFARNFETISDPKVKETPRSFSPQPIVSLSGSDQSRSHNNPEKEEEREWKKRWLKEMKNGGEIARAVRGHHDLTHLDQEHQWVSRYV